MDQEIGIKFTAHGLADLKRDLRAAGKEIGKFVTQVNQLSAKLRGTSAGVNVLNKSITSLNTRSGNLVKGGFGQISIQADQIERQLNQATGAMNRFSKAAASVPKVNLGVGPVGRRGGGDPTYPGVYMPDGRRYGAFGFLGRFWAGHAVGTGVGRTVADTMFGRARVGLLDPMKDLAAIEFNEKQRYTTEMMGQRFIRDFPAVGNQQQYLASVAEAGSAFDVRDKMFRGKGLEQINKMAQASMLMGAATQMRPEAATSLLMSVVHAQLKNMPMQERGLYDSGQKSVLNLTESTAAKMAEIIRVTSAWGIDLQHFLTYSLPSAMAKGLDLDTVLALAGVTKTAGLKGQKAGRGFRALLEAETGKLAALSMAGGSQAEYEKWKGMTAGERKDYIAENVLPDIKKQMSTDIVGFFQNVGEWMQKAEARKVDPVQSLGISRQWIGTTRMLGQGAMQQDWRKARAAAARVNDLSRVKAGIEDVQRDAGYQSIRLKNSWEAFKQSAGRSGPVSELMDDWASTLDHMTDMINRGATREEYLQEAVDFAIHGLYGGLHTELKKATVGILQRMELVGKDIKLDTFEQDLQQFKDHVAFIQKTWVEILNAVNDQLQTMATGIDIVRATVHDAAGVVSRLDPRTWWSEESTTVQGRAPTKLNLPGGAAAARDFGGTKSGIYIPKPPTRRGPRQSVDTGPVMGRRSGAQGVPNIHVDAHPSKVEVESRVYLSERELYDVVKQVINGKLKENGESFGTSPVPFF